MLHVCNRCDGFHDAGERCPVAKRQTEQARDESRPSREQRGYDYAWRKLSAQVVAEEGRCRACGTTGSHANPLTGQHIIALALGGARLDRWNVECLCRRCNSSAGKKGGE